MARWKKRLTDGPESSGTGERGESGVRTLLGRKVGWAYMPKGRRGAGRWGERQGEGRGSGQALLAASRGKEKRPAGQIPEGEFFFLFLFLLFQGIFKSF